MIKDYHSGEITTVVAITWKKFGAGEGIRTLDVNLGKVALYH